MKDGSGTKLIIGAVGGFAALVTVFVLLAGAVQGIAQTEIKVELGPFKEQYKHEVGGLRSDIDTIKAEVRSISRHLK